MPFINALLSTSRSFVKAFAYVLVLFIHTSIKMVVKIQFIPTRIKNAMYIHKLKKELSKEIKEQLIK